MAWVAAGGTPTTEEPTLTPGRFEAAPVDAIVIGADEVFAKSQSGAITVIDVRDATEFGGKDNTVCCTRRGHIPKAVWLEWTELLDAATGKFKPVAEVQRLLAARGIDRSAFGGRALKFVFLIALIATRRREFRGVSPYRRRPPQQVEENGNAAGGVEVLEPAYEANKRA